jgi:serine/tyrosine/threonine adenylyltransferase
MRTMPVSPDHRPATVHAELGDAFFDVVEPATFPKHVLRYRTQRWADRVGLGALTDSEWIAHFGRFEPLPDGFRKPLALRYHGHQFRVYNPELGDGRGFLFAQMRDLEDDRLLDLSTKGSGQTPWSRGADGRLTLKGGVREILATEMLEALGVDTSKSFSLIETGEQLYRSDEPSPTRSSVLVRLSHSSIRIGTFQRLLFLDQHQNIVRLMDHAIHHYMPNIWREDVAERAVAFVEEVGRRVAETGARWMLAGFVHGVLNTDNINITGESFDYGPWRFAPVLDPAFTAAYFDEFGLYAYGRQPDALLWNMTRLAECMLPFAPQAELQRVLEAFAPEFRTRFNRSVLRRLGLISAGAEADQELAAALWRVLAETKIPFERFFFDWRGGLDSAGRMDRSPSRETYTSAAFQPLREALSAYEARPGATSHPYFAREEPCTMLIDEVEALWEPIARDDDWSSFERKLAEIADLRAAYADDHESFG